MKRAKRMNTECDLLGVVETRFSLVDVRMHILVEMFGEKILALLLFFSVRLLKP